MEEDIITVFEKNYRVVPNSDGYCKGCAANVEEDICSHFVSKNEDSCCKVTFQEVTELEVRQESLVRPPIGIMPLRTHNAIRLNALMETLLRYAESGTPAKPEWVREAVALRDFEREYVRNLNQEALDKVPFKL